MLVAYEDTQAHDVPGTLHWRERSDGHWIATSALSGHYELVPKEGLWQAWRSSLSETPVFLGQAGTLGGGMQIASKDLSSKMYPSRHHDGSLVAAEGGDGGCSHTHPSSVPSMPCPDPSAHVHVEQTRVAVVEKTKLRAGEGTRKLQLACERPAAAAPLGARENASDVSAYSTSARDPKEVEAGRALGPANNPEAIYRIVSESLSKESQEVFLVLPLDLRGQLLCRPVEVARGQNDRVTVSKSNIFKPVHLHEAKGFVCVHVHPSGHASPSVDDKKLTQALCKAIAEGALDGDTKFVDHVIIARSAEKGEYYSFRESGHMTGRCTWVPHAKKVALHKVEH